MNRIQKAVSASRIGKRALFFNTVAAAEGKMEGQRMKIIFMRLFAELYRWTILLKLREKNGGLSSFVVMVLSKIWSIILKTIYKVG